LAGSSSAAHAHSPVVRPSDGWHPDLPDRGWARLHAVDLLCDLAADDALEPLLRAFARCDPSDPLRERILERLPSLGPAIVEPLLAMYPHEDELTRLGLAYGLARCGSGDERVVALLLEQLASRYAVGAAADNLAELGDRRALPDLKRAFDRVLRGKVIAGGRDIPSLAAAIEQLGGALTLPQRRAYRRHSRSAWSADAGVDAD
jgi:HEAT repeat protein